MNELALFAGAGGGLLGSILNGWTTVCAVEIDPYCRSILLQRQVDGALECFPVWPDVKTFDGRPWRGCVDIITAGFPCQPFSVAGKRAGERDDRNLWPETIRVIREVRPRFAFLENVPGLFSSGYFGTILGGLAESGYDARWCVLGADDVGAPHRRKRLWILAHDQKHGRREGRARGFDSSGAGESELALSISDSQRDLLRLQPGRTESRRTGEGEPRNDGAEESVADADQRRFESERLGGLLDGGRAALRDDPDGCDRQVADADQRRREGERVAQHEQESSALRDLADGRSEGRFGGRADVADAAQQPEREQDDQACAEPREGSWPSSSGRGWWQSEPDVGRVAHGVAARVDRLKALGNGQVPAVVRAAWEILNG